jgi:hypothetical protein
VEFLRSFRSRGSHTKNTFYTNTHQMGESNSDRKRERGREGEREGKRERERERERDSDILRKGLWVEISLNDFCKIDPSSRDLNNKPFSYCYS